MKSLLPSLLRAACALCVGLLLVSSPQAVTSWMVRVIGALFVLSGVLPTASVWLPRLRAGGALRPALPVAGAGSILLGLLLLVWPDAFGTALMYALGFFLLLAGGSQLATLIAWRSVAPLRWWVAVMPALLIAAGAFVTLHPLSSASLPFVILGAACIAYAVSTALYAARYAWFERKRRSFDKYEEVE